MLKRLIPAMFGLALLVTACGPQGTPTMAPADIQNTAVAAALTMVAATQQAIPTVTPLPPTETPSPTPLPTFTPLALPTLPEVLPTATSAAASGDCIKPLNTGEAGPTVPMRIENVSDGDIYSISLNLWAPNAFGQCGALSYTNIKRNSTKTIALPKGSWYAYAWINFRNGSSGTASGSFVLRPGDDEGLRILVGNEAISVKP